MMKAAVKRSLARCVSLAALVLVCVAGGGCATVPVKEELPARWYKNIQAWDLAPMQVSEDDGIVCRALLHREWPWMRSAAVTISLSNEGGGMALVHQDPRWWTFGVSGEESEPLSAMRPDAGDLMRVTPNQAQILRSVYGSLSWDEPWNRCLSVRGKLYRQKPDMLLECRDGAGYRAMQLSSVEGSRRRDFVALLMRFAYLDLPEPQYAEFAPCATS